MELLLWPSSRAIVDSEPGIARETGCIGEPLGAVTLPEGVSCFRTPDTAGAFFMTQSRDLELRRHFILNLTKCAKHDFHEQSQTHFFFGYYTASCALRSFHPFKDKAFEVYLVLANRLAMAAEDANLREWIDFIERGSSENETEVGILKPELPCSGVINFRLNKKTSERFGSFADELSSSLNQTSALLLSKTIPSLKADIRSLGVEKSGTSVRQFYEIDPTWKLYTVRVPKKTHAQLLAMSHELSVSLSAISSYLIHRFLHLPAFVGRL